MELGQPFVTVVSLFLYILMCYALIDVILKSLLELVIQSKQYNVM